MQVSGTSSGLYYFILILLKGKAPSSAKVGNGVSGITFLHTLPLWPLEPERPGDKNQHRMGKDIQKQHTIDLLQYKQQKDLNQLFLSCSDPGPVGGMISHFSRHLHI